jgi:drug/metabolite transporter (DMT)-like permease
MRKKIHQVWYKNKGIGYMLISSLCFALMSALAKSMSDRFGSVELVFFRSAVGLPFLLTSLIRRPAVLHLRTFGIILDKYLWASFPTIHCYF